MGSDSVVGRVVTAITTCGMSEILGPSVGRTVMGILTGGLSLLTEGVIMGAITGRMFTSVSAFLFEPTRYICEVLGITDQNIEQGYISVCKVFKENQYPDTLVTSCIKRSKDGSDLMTYYYNFSKVGTAQFDRYYYMGRKRYVDHLPDCNITTSTYKKETIKKAVQKDLNKTVEILTTDINYPPDATWAAYTLQQQGKYDYETDLVTIDNKSFEIHNVTFDRNTGKLIAHLRGVQGNASNTDISIDPAEIQVYYIVTYKDLTTNKIKYWIHATDLKDLGVDFFNEDPDKMLKAEMKILPIACLRNSKINVNEVTESDDCCDEFKAPERPKQTEKLLKTLGLSLEQIIEGYSKNENINDVYEAYFMPGVSPWQTCKDDAKRDDPEGYEYSVEVVAKAIYKTVKDIYKILPCVVEGQPYFITIEELPFKGQVLWAGVPEKEVIGKKCKTRHYAMSLGESADYRYKVIIQELSEYLGEQTRTRSEYDIDGYPIGSYTYTVHEYKAEYFAVELSSEPITPAKIFESFENRVPFTPSRNESSKDSFINGTREHAAFPNTVDLADKIDDNKIPQFRILKTTQYTSYDADTDSYEDNTRYDWEPLDEKPQNTGLNLDNYVTKWKEPPSLTIYYQYKKNEYKQLVLRNLCSIYFTNNVGNDLLSTAMCNTDEFIFPISYYTLKHLSVYDKTKFLSEGFYLVFFAKHTEHLMFYQTKEFGTFLQIVGVIITIIVTIFTWGTQTATTQMLIQSLIQMAVIYVGVTLALQVIATYVSDSTLKAVLSAAVLVAAMYFGGGFDKINLSTAVQLADVAVKAVDIYTKDQLKYVQQDLIDLQARYKDAQQKIDEAAGKLTYGIDTQDVLATQEFARSWDGRVMSREEFYTITLTCPDLYSVCQDQIDRSKTVDLDTTYPLYDM